MHVAINPNDDGTRDILNGFGLSKTAYDETLELIDESFEEIQTEMQVLIDEISIGVCQTRKVNDFYNHLGSVVEDCCSLLYYGPHHNWPNSSSVIGLLKILGKMNSKKKPELKNPCKNWWQIKKFIDRTRGSPKILRDLDQMFFSKRNPCSHTRIPKPTSEFDCKYFKLVERFLKIVSEAVEELFHQAESE